MNKLFVLLFVYTFLFAHNIHLLTIDVAIFNLYGTIERLE